jgi:MFS family permease
MSETDRNADRACPLSWPEQRRNLVLFALSIGMNYLAAPVLYIGITHAALCETLEADTATSNLPATMFFAMTAMVTLIAWASPKPSSLKRNLSLCYSCCAAVLAALTVTLLMDVSAKVKIGMVILQGGVVGAVMPAATAYLWEAIGRGTDESRRGLALGMAFGGGPLLAVIGSFCQILILGGTFSLGPYSWDFAGIAYPWNFVILFGTGVPMMGLAILFGLLLIVPPERHEPRRAPLASIVGALIGVPAMAMFFYWMYLAGLGDSLTFDLNRSLGIGLSGSALQLTVRAETLRWAGYASLIVSVAALSYHFREILKQRTLLLATAVTLLVYCGNMIPPNMNLYSTEALRDRLDADAAVEQASPQTGLPAKYAGTQNLYRFSFKMLAGIFLGWLLTRTNPRAGILATSLLFLCSQLWAIFVTGPWYLVAFGIFGAGELIGVYAPNYLVSASRKEDLRKTTAFMTMLMAPAAPVGYLYGTIVDVVKRNGWTALGMSSATLGFRLSFFVCALFILGGIIVAATMLPKHPRASGGCS